MIKAVLMDFNGVIIDDEPVQMKAYQKVLAEEGVPLTEAEYYSCLGMDDRTFVRAAYTRNGKEVPDDKVSELVDAKGAVWRELIKDGVPLFPGVEGFIRKTAREFSLGIVSMARRQNIEYALERSGLRDRFEMIVSAEDVSKHKPDPECYLLGFEAINKVRALEGLLAVHPHECLVIEDAPQGVVAGKRAGMKTIGVVNTVPEDRMREVAADAVAKDIADWMPESIRRVFV